VLSGIYYNKSLSYTGEYRECNQLCHQEYTTTKAYPTQVYTVCVISFFIRDILQTNLPNTGIHRVCNQLFHQGYTTTKTYSTQVNTVSVISCVIRDIQQKLTLHMWIPWV